ncbi:MAG: DNA repair protein RadC [Alphaproteobacteria bacterium]|nr:DNA repair protein RadC [Alphaproteobacteria bacterium]MBN2779805.1 DNA repair protein RadC [Alphaproteobacteria bacterium]
MDEKHYLGHRQRLLERFQKHADSLQDYELIELLLTYAIPRRDVKALAKTIERDVGLKDLFQPEKLQKMDLSDRSQSLFLLVKTLFERHLKTQVKKGAVLQNWAHLLSYCTSKFSDKTREEFHVLFLDSKFELIEDKKVAQGTLDHATVYPREVVKEALSVGARSVILVHNHPSGDLIPSHADITLTKKIVEALQTVDVQTHDHIIVGKGETVSFKELGLWVGSW